MDLKKLIQAAVIAAIYAVLTIALAPISYGPMQIRVSEALTVLPALTGAAVPGLFIGCVIANVVGPFGIVDIVLGSVTTLIAAFASYKLKNHPKLVPLPPVIANGVIIGGMLYYVYGVPMNLFLCMGWVAIGELVACYVIGLPLLKLLSKYKDVFK